MPALTRTVPVAELFPYPPRPHQLDVVHAAHAALDAGGHAVIESGTGTGKTVCALTAALAAARRRKKRVLYLTRTNAQERQVVIEYRQLAPARTAGASATGASAASGSALVALQGRRHLCPLVREDPEVGAANAEELGVMCRDRCKAADRAHEGKRGKVPPCAHYERTRYGGAGDALAHRAREEPLTAEELAAEAEALGACPYIVSRDLLPDAEVVVAPYVYFFHPGLRSAFLRWCGASARDFVVVVDEAHNLPDYARDLASARLGTVTLDRAREESRTFGDPFVLNGHKLTDLLDVVDGIIRDVAERFIPDGEEDAIVPPDEVDVALMEAFAAPTPAIDKALAVVSEYGAAVRDSRRKNGKVPRSYVGAVADFLEAYRKADASTHVRLATRGEHGPVLEAFAVDPAVVTDVLRETAGSVHVSGTLEPLEQYRDTIGLDADAPVFAFPSPFPRGNRLALFDPDVTTRYDDLRRDPDMWRKIGTRLRAFREGIPERNLAVFVPSYEALARVIPFLDPRTTIVDPRDGAQDALMRAVTAFKEQRGRTLVSVMGGRLAEGFDFPDATLEAVCIIGLPYPKPTARQQALVRFNDRAFGRGWDYAVRAPMVRKVLQAAGRLIRSPTDRGVLYLMDKRAALLRDVVPDLRATRDPAVDAERFFLASKP